MTRGRSPDRDDDTTPAHRGGETSPASPGRQDAIRDITIEHIETVPMTPDEYDTAVSVLAELVLHWERKGAPNTAPKRAA
jgi:hypothetical protein